MQLKDLQSTNNPRRPKKRIARGGKRGVYSGRGGKGQTARAGHRLQPIIRQFLKKYPKLRGYHFKSFLTKPIIIDLAFIEKNWDATKILTPRTLLSAKLISRVSKSVPNVKILGDGELTKKIKVAGCLVSEQAQDKIKKAGGSVVAFKIYKKVLKKSVVKKEKKPKTEVSAEAKPAVEAKPVAKKATKKVSAPKTKK